MPGIVEKAARAGGGVYPFAPYYVRPPQTARFLLGYASMEENKIEDGDLRVGKGIALQMTKR